MRVIMLENNRLLGHVWLPIGRSLPGDDPAQRGGSAQELLRRRPLLERQLHRVHLRSASQHGQPTRLPRIRLRRLSDRATGRPAASNREWAASTRHGVTTSPTNWTDAGFTWKGYMEDMGNDPTRDGRVTCGHPAVGASSDPTTSAEAGDGYTTRHDPFVVLPFDHRQRHRVRHQRGPARRHQRQHAGGDTGRGHRPCHRSPIRRHDAQRQLHHTEPLR